MQAPKEWVAACASSTMGDSLIGYRDYRGIKDIPIEVLNANIVDVEAGTQHLMAKDDTGKWYPWGYNHQLQVQIHDRFVEAFKTDLIMNIFGGYERTIVITESGAVYI